VLRVGQVAQVIAAIDDPGCTGIEIQQMDLSVES